MTREDAATIFERIAILLEMQGENPFKVRAYRTGAELVESFSGDIMKLAADNQLAGIKGLGEALRDKLHEMATTGRLEFYEKLKAQFPDTIFELFNVQGLGPKKIAALHAELGVSSIADLKRACECGEAAKLSGFGAKVVQKILDSIAFREEHASEFRQDQVHGLVQEILEALRGHPDVSQAEICGSFRRGKETVHDLDFLVSTKQPAQVIEDFVKLPVVVDVIAKGPTKASIHATHGIQCDLRAVSGKEFPFALMYFTGSKEHNVAIRQRALARGWSLNEYAFTPVPDHADVPVIPPVHDEADLYRALGLDFIDPELRENTGEIDAAEDGRLPRLVQLENLRGVFHNHTTASDGGATLRQMAEAAHDLGLQYLGIADHSKSSFQANGLDEKRLLAQIEEIKKLNEEYAEEGFRLFTGSEVDILKDGSLDFSDEILAQLDYVVASVHNVFNLPEAEMTKRIIRAIENPHVTMLGHLTGRLLLQRPAYQVNVAAVIDAAAETGTIIELNASAWRLDMDWRWWKLAKEKGVKCSINPDAHSTRGLQDVIFGIKSARKGWLTRKDILNCLPLEEVGEVLRAKRAR
ncbi:MAG: DNA polymerase/3'-5' exonuclease PolX [Prosthecobacter sp.]|jgi:DNA polymerase (family 10)|uniref:DNA polymerase/3'-5' exonuclease PolX n=1 Tax=Prosthecobacter sp. TaxID=1965333 RepID=UPI0019DE5CA6|nr:DNA polymerase/3'-5' exonuclease PolX [Prosthecobacter sp.]MBE2283779.1 DNA polymerase/3'-5' exonuclease PolX [Prosthecobacter sp.]